MRNGRVRVATGQGLWESFFDLKAAAARYDSADWHWTCWDSPGKDRFAAGSGIGSHIIVVGPGIVKKFHMEASPYTTSISKLS